MKKYLLPFVLGALMLGSCQQKPAATKEPATQFNNQLTAEEKAGGVMTPEIMWKFSAFGSNSKSQ